MNDIRDTINKLEEINEASWRYNNLETSLYSIEKMIKGIHNQMNRLKKSGEITEQESLYFSDEAIGVFQNAVDLFNYYNGSK